MNNSINYSSFIDLIRERDSVTQTTKYSTRDVAHSDEAVIPDPVHDEHHGHQKSKIKKQGRHP